MADAMFLLNTCPSQVQQRVTGFNIACAPIPPFPITKSLGALAKNANYPQRPNVRDPNRGDQGLWNSTLWPGSVK
jgi:hypothetical protein